MTLKQTLIRNSIWIYSTDIIGKILSYFLIVAIARNLGEVGLGEYSFIFAFASLSIMFSDFGTSYFLMKETSRNVSNANIHFPTVISIRLTFSILAICIFTIMSFHLGKPPHVVTGLIIALCLLLVTTAIEPYSSLLQSTNRIKVIAIANLLERVSAFAAGLYVLVTYKSLILVIAVFFGSNLLRQMIIFASARKLVNFRLDFNFRNWVSLLSRSIPFGFMGIFMFIYFRTDTIMLSLMVGDQATGIYNAAAKLTETMLFIPNLMLFVIVPSISYLFKHDMVQLQALIQRTLKYLVYLSFPMTVGTVLLADRFISFIYADQFGASAGVLQVLIIATFFGFLNGIFANLLTATDQQRYFLKISGLLAGLNVVLNLMLIPKYAALGAAIATVITQAMNFILVNHYSQKHVLRISYRSIVAKPIICSIIMGIVIVNFSSLAIWYLLPLGVFAYLTSSFLLGIDDEDKALVRELFRATGKNA